MATAEYIRVLLEDYMGQVTYGSVVGTIALVLALINSPSMVAAWKEASRDGDQQ